MRAHVTQQPLDRPAPKYVLVLVTPAVVDAVTRRLEERTSSLELTSLTSHAGRAD